MIKRKSKRKPKVEIRAYNADGTPNEHGALDEIVAKNVFVHLEYMSLRHVWISIGDVHVNLIARGVISASVSESAKPE